MKKMNENFYNHKFNYFVQIITYKSPCVYVDK